jgi:hypothetical protein
MNCERLENLWQAWLDDPLGPSPALDPEAETHCAGCESCRQRSAGYAVLSAALTGAPQGPESPSPDFADRAILAYQVELRVEAGRRTWRRWGALAAAALLVVSSGLGLWFARSGAPDHPAPVAVIPVRPEPVRLSDALAEATSATIELALESSAPAARLGRDMLDSTRRVRPPSADLANPVEASEALEGAGRRLTSEVPPLSDQARRAFGFLLGPVSGLQDAESPARDGA